MILKRINKIIAIKTTRIDKIEINTAPKIRPIETHVEIAVLLKSVDTEYSIVKTY